MNILIKRAAAVAISTLASASVFATEPPAAPASPSALCLSIRADLEKTVKTISKLPPQEQARKLDAFDHAHENPESCNVDRIIEVQDAAELQLVKLDADGTKIMPAKVSRCVRLETEDKKCNGYYADDTSSSREGQARNEAIPTATTIRLESKWSGAKLECVFVLSPSRKGPPACSRNAVMPRPERGSIVAAVYRVGGYVPLRKYVWFVN